MQGTTSFRALVALGSLVTGHAASTTTGTTTSTSTTTVAATTITVTVDSGISRVTPQLTHSTIPPGSDTLVTGLVPYPTAISYTTTSTITHTTTMSLPPGSLESAVLNSTNYYRARHLADPVRWNDTLADYANNWAQGCILEHSDGPYGENLAANFENPSLAIDAWAYEEKHYDYASGKFTERNGHFTQLVWKNTTDVGCAVVDCNNPASDGVQGPYLVCEYSPRGNVEGQFRWNVQKPGISDDGTLGFGSLAAIRASSPGALVLALAASWALSISVL